MGCVVGALLSQEGIGGDRGFTEARIACAQPRRVTVTVNAAVSKSPWQVQQSRLPQSPQESHCRPWTRPQADGSEGLGATRLHSVAQPRRAGGLWQLHLWLCLPGPQPQLMVPQTCWQLQPQPTQCPCCPPGATTTRANSAAEVPEAATATAQGPRQLVHNPGRCQGRSHRGPGADTHSMYRKPRGCRAVPAAPAPHWRSQRWQGHVSWCSGSLPVTHI